MWVAAILAGAEYNDCGGGARVRYDWVQEAMDWQPCYDVDMKASFIGFHYCRSRRAGLCRQLWFCLGRCRWWCRPAAWSECPRELHNFEPQISIAV